MNKQTARTETILGKLMGSRWGSLLEGVPRDILVRISPEAASTAQGQLIATFTMNLLIRLHPVVNRLYLELPQDHPSFDCLPRWRKESLLSTLRAMHESVNPPVELYINQRPGSMLASHVTIGVGEQLGVQGLWVGCNNWIAALSPIGTEDLSPTTNPIGAYVTATLAVSEAWKRILFPLRDEIRGIVIQPLDQPLFFSALDYSQVENGPNPDLPKDPDIGRLSMIGLGAGGGATAFTLASFPELRGIINVIEPDEVEWSNLNRYVFADHTDTTRKRPKTDCIEDLFKSNNGIKIRPWSRPFDQMRNDLAVEDYRHVIAAVHSRGARHQIQYETPKVLWDAGATEQGDFYVWRIILGQTQCMFCKHPIDEGNPEREKSEQLSKLLGLDPETWQKKMTNNEAFTEEEIETIGPRIEFQKLEISIPEPGQRLAEWSNKCGRLELPEVDEEIPIPFSPVMAGILLAGEVLKEKFFPENVLRGYYWNNLTARFNPRLLPRISPPKKECTFCSDRTFLGQYTRRWT